MSDRYEDWVEHLRADARRWCLMKGTGYVVSDLLVKRPGNRLAADWKAKRCELLCYLRDERDATYGDLAALLGSTQTGAWLACGNVVRHKRSRRREFMEKPE